MVPEKFTQYFQHVGILCKPFCQNVPRTVERRFHIGDSFFCIDVFVRFLLRIERRIGYQSFCQRFKSCLFSNLCTRTALRLIRQIQVLKTLFGIGFLNLLFEIFSEFSRVRKRLENRSASFFEFSPVNKLLFKHAQLRIVKPSCCFFSIASNKRHRRAVIKKSHSSGNLLDACIDGLSNVSGNTCLDGRGKFFCHESLKTKNG